MFESLKEIYFSLMSLGINVVGFTMIVLFYVFLDTEKEKEERVLRVDFDALGKIGGLLFLLMLFRAAHLHRANFAPDGFPLFDVLFVFLEDATFVLPLFLVERYFPKYFKLAVVISSLMFASGHFYISTLWAIVTFFYPYFISMRYGKKYGMGTIMAAHVCYDISTILIVKIMHVVNLVGA